MLHGINLTVRHGETIALVGPNGCGKTTLMNLLPRFWDVDSGSIRIDGHDIREVQLRSLRRQIGMVIQETVLFQDTIANNIAYGYPHASRAAIVAAAERAYAHQFIMALPQGYDTLIGERGYGLSGGQRQRIALARAMLRDPAILILDEATSAVDIQDELLIRKAIEEFAKNRTTFLISHSLASIQFADRIVLIERRVGSRRSEPTTNSSAPPLSTAGSMRSTITAIPPEHPPTRSSPSKVHLCPLRIRSVIRRPPKRFDPRWTIATCFQRTSLTVIRSLIECESDSSAAEPGNCSSFAIQCGLAQDWVVTAPLEANDQLIWRHLYEPLRRDEEAI